VRGRQGGQVGHGALLDGVGDRAQRAQADADDQPGRQQQQGQAEHGGRGQEADARHRQHPQVVDLVAALEYQAAGRVALDRAHPAVLAQQAHLLRRGQRVRQAGARVVQQAAVLPDAQAHLRVVVELGEHLRAHCLQFPRGGGQLARAPGQQGQVQQRFLRVRLVLGGGAGALGDAGVLQHVGEAEQEHDHDHAGKAQHQAPEQRGGAGVLRWRGHAASRWIT
jgi:hypothetical protein